MQNICKGGLNERVVRSYVSRSIGNNGTLKYGSRGEQHIPKGYGIPFYAGTSAQEECII